MGVAAIALEGRNVLSLNPSQLYHPADCPPLTACTWADCPHHPWLAVPLECGVPGSTYSYLLSCNTGDVVLPQGLCTRCASCLGLSSLLQKLGPCLLSFPWTPYEKELRSQRYSSLHFTLSHGPARHAGDCGQFVVCLPPRRPRSGALSTSFAAVSPEPIPDGCVGRGALPCVNPAPAPAPRASRGTLAESLPLSEPQLLFLTTESRPTTKWRSQLIPRRWV